MDPWNSTPPLQTVLFTRCRESARQGTDLAVREILLRLPPRSAIQEKRLLYETTFATGISTLW